MGKWGIPEKGYQNAVQKCSSQKSGQKIGGSQNLMKEQYLSKTPNVKFVYLSQCNIKLPVLFGNSKKRFLWTGLMTTMLRGCTPLCPTWPLCWRDTPHYALYDHYVEGIHPTMRIKWGWRWGWGLVSTAWSWRRIWGRKDLVGSIGSRIFFAFLVLRF